MKNSNGVKLIWVVIIAIVALVAGFLIRGAIGGQGASVAMVNLSAHPSLNVSTDLPAPKMVTAGGSTFSGIIGVFWQNGGCATYTWNDVTKAWDWIGVNNLDANHCKNLPVSGTTNVNKVALSSTTTTNGGPAATKTGVVVTVPYIWHLAWDSVNGCRIYSWSGTSGSGSWVPPGGTGTSVPQDKCHDLIQNPNTAGGTPVSSTTTPVTGSAPTVQVKSTR